MSVTKPATKQSGAQSRTPAPAQLPRGFIDGLQEPDCIVGWACPARYSWRPVRVKLRAGNRWAASGIACHYRPDLVAAQVGTGWCGFVLRTGLSTAELSKSTIFLAEETGSVLAKAERLQQLQDSVTDLRSVADVIAYDPTVVRSIEQLRGCGEMFTRYIRIRGVDAFVRTAYLYTLNRPADESGLRLYAGRIRRGLHQPFEVLQILAASEEFAARQPNMMAPTESSFPFLVA